MPSIFTTTVAALAVAPFVTGHSWVEQLRNVNSADAVSLDGVNVDNEAVLSLGQSRAPQLPGEITYVVARVVTRD